MRTINKTSLAVALSMLAVAFSLPRPAQAVTNYVADYPGAVRILTRAWAFPVRKGAPAQQVFDSQNLVLYEINTAWSNYQPLIANALRSKLGQDGAVISGQHLYNITIALANAGNLSAWQETGGLGLQYNLIGNYIKATSTQPLPGSWEDPTFSVTFDIHLVVHLAVPTDMSPVSVTSAVATVSNAHLNPIGVAADVAFFVSDLVSWFGGPNFVADVTNEIDHQKTNLTSVINAGLGGINGQIAQAKTKGFRSLSYALDPNARLLTLTLVQGNPYVIQLNRQVLAAPRQ